VFYFSFFIIILPLTSLLEQIAATEMINTYWIEEEKKIERLYKQLVAKRRRAAWQKVQKTMQRDLEWLSSSSTPKRRTFSTIWDTENRSPKVIITSASQP